MKKISDLLKKLSYNIGLKMLKLSLKNNDVNTYLTVDDEPIPFSLKKPLNSELVKLNDFDTNYIIFKSIITNTNPSNLQLYVEYNNYMTMGYILTDKVIEFSDENDDTIYDIKNGTKTLTKVYNLIEYPMTVTGNSFNVDISTIDINPIDKVKCMVNVKLIDISDNFGTSTIYYHLV